MHATFLHMKDPFRPHINRDASPLLPGRRVRTILRDKGLIVGKENKRVAPFIVQLNGKALLEKQWYKTIIRDQDVLSVTHLPRGGGNSNPLQIIGMIALIIVAMYAPYALGMAGTFAGSLVTAGIMIGGSLILNMMFPPTQPSISQTSRGTTSPTYTLSAQGNNARLMEAIPVLYGRMRVYPDFAASPYSEVLGNDEYLYQLFCISQGQLSIEKIQVEDTDISTFPEVEYEVVQPNQPITLFPTNVATSVNVSNLRMYGTNESGAGYLGPFVINTAGSSCNAIGVDVSLPNGAFTVDDKGNYQPVTVSYQFDYQLIDDSGAAIGSWTNFIDQSVTFSDSQPQRIGAKVSVPNGRYQVRARRTNAAAADTRTSDALYWNTLRAYLTAPNNYGNLTMLAVKMKATNTLSSQNSRKINVIATRMLQTWDPVNGWTVNPVATKSPAWAFADIIRNPDYGRNLPDSRLNLPELYRLSQVWASRGDEFNGVFDTTSQLWDALQKVAKVGRAMPIYYAGLIDIVRNEPKTLPVAMFAPSNIQKGSFSTTYQFADVDTPDHVVIEYVNQDTWKPDTVKCVLPGGTDNNPAHIQLFGCTNHDQAWREGITMAAINRDQRRLTSISTELDGLIPKYGDLCQISHDVPAWGYSGRVVSLNKLTGEIETSEPIPFNDGSTGGWSIAFRRRDGSADGPYSITQHPSGDINKGVVHGYLNDVYVSNGVREDFTQYQFGPNEKAGLLAQCFSVSPDNTGSVKLTFVNYADSVFAAETGGVVPPPNPSSNLPTPPTAPIIDHVSLEYSFSVGQQRIVATPANGAQYYEFQVSPDAGATWINYGTSQDPKMNVALASGVWLIRVRGIGVITGAWTTASVTVTDTVLPLVSIDAFTASTDVVFAIKLDWVLAAGNAGIADHVEIWHGLNNVIGNAVLLVTLPASVTTFTHGNMGPGEDHFYYIRVVDQAGRQGPWFFGGIAVHGQSSSDASKIIDQIGQNITEGQLASSLLTKVNNGNAGYAQAEQTVSDLAAMYTIKTQITADGRTYMAGVGVGVYNNQGVIESQVIVAASKFAVLDPNTTGSLRAPFIIQGGIVYMDTAFIRDGTITNAKIADATITNAKIALATITNAQIANATIVTANIADGQITNAKIGTAAVQTANIADGNITNAKIGNASVATLNIQGEAVTVPRGSYNNGSGSGTQTPVSVAQPAQSTGVIVTATVGLFSSSGGSALVQIRRDTNVIYQMNIQLTSGVPAPVTPFAGTIVDTTSPGGSTYDLTIIPSGTVTWTNAAISCIGCKR